VPSRHTVFAPSAAGFVALVESAGVVDAAGGVGDGAGAAAGAGAATGIGADGVGVTAAVAEFPGVVAATAAAATGGGDSDDGTAIGAVIAVDGVAAGTADATPFAPVVVVFDPAPLVGTMVWALAMSMATAVALDNACAFPVISAVGTDDTAGPVAAFAVTPFASTSAGGGRRPSPSSANREAASRVRRLPAA